MRSKTTFILVAVIGASLLAAAAVAGDPGATVLHIEGAAAVTDDGGYTDPAWAPDGEAVSLAGPGSRGLYRVDLDSGALTTLSEPSDTVAYRHRWLDGPPRILCPPRGDHPAREVDRETGASRPLPDWTEPVRAHRDDIYLRQPAGDLRLTQGEDRFFDPVLSPDGTRVVFVGLATGIHVMEIDGGELAHLGPGTRPTWTPDGRWVLFERTRDDGQRMTSGQLMAHAVDRGVTVELTDGTYIDRHPAVTADGTRIAFVRDGALWVARLTEVAR